MERLQPFLHAATSGYLDALRADSPSAAAVHNWSQSRIDSSVDRPFYDTANQDRYLI
jgi:hypothetical protein